MEILAYTWAVGVPLLLVSLCKLASFYEPLAGIIYLFGPPISYIVLWVRLIRSKKDSPKTLWRFIAQWSIWGIYVATCLISNPAAKFPEGTIFATIWYWANLPFTMMSLYNPGDLFMPKTYMLLCAIMAYICAKPIIKNYKLTKKLW